MATLSHKRIKKPRAAHTSIIPSRKNRSRPLSVQKKSALKKLAHTTKARLARSLHVTQKVKAEPYECFWVNCGPVVDDLAGLARAFAEMSDEQYAYHVFDHGNDFARWVEDVFGEKALARKLVRSKSREGARRIVVAHISLRQ